MRHLLRFVLAVAGITFGIGLVLLWCQATMSFNQPAWKMFISPLGAVAAFIGGSFFAWLWEKTS